MAAGGQLPEGVVVAVVGGGRVVGGAGAMPTTTSTAVRSGIDSPAAIPWRSTRPSLGSPTGRATVRNLASTPAAETASAAVGRALTLADPETVWVISRGVVEGDIAENRLVQLDIDTRPTIGAVGVMSLADEVPTPATRAFAIALGRAAKLRRTV